MLKLSGPAKDLKIGRLKKALEAIPDMMEREPRVGDPDYRAWHDETVQTLSELFIADPFGYLNRFVRISFVHSISVRGGYLNERVLARDAGEVWRGALAQAKVLLTSAIEEAEHEPAPRPQARSQLPAPTPQPNIVVNVNTQNTFSFAVHVQLSELLERIDAAAGLSDAEKGIAKEELAALEAETKGNQRWPVIARSLEAAKALGQDVYRNVFVPLLVEYLKHQIDPTRKP